MRITVLFLDEKVNSVIHGFIPAGRANHYMSSLKVGSIVKIDRFEVVWCSSMYKITDHPFLICFISPTINDEVITDVVEQICSVQGSDLTKETTRVLIRLLIDPFKKMSLSASPVPQIGISGIRHSTFESLCLGCNSVIHGFIPAGRANHYMSSLKAGSIVKIDRFEVVRCSSMYKITDHPFLIRFISPTFNDEVITDVLRQIRSVQGSDLTKETTRVLIHLLIDP
ncbi:hypothetical protein DY000_02023498 [Brassica cretica]|uniref:Replication protein A 70 kDa DNA-binding subunit B/D first OB fold domain-containing protein n=1 Tax=Brassica cretica TaxID=69181 RepID=A0ABQ7E8C3_BRACR|nr:hypothetical protein DY000_02023498 [Brassica cretica]